MLVPKFFISAMALSVLLTGCGSAVVTEGDPLWRVPMNPYGQCNSIEGIYLDRGLLSRQFTDSSINSARLKFSSSKGFGRHVPHKELTLEELSARGLVSQKEMQNAQMNHYRHQERIFYDKATLRVTQTADEIKVILYGADELPYQEININGRHPDVGCDAHRNLVLRKSSRTGGAELTPGQAHVSETVFSKLNDGSLEIHSWTRNWVKTMKDAPKEEVETTLIFAPSP